MKAVRARRQQGFSIVAVIVSLAFVFVVGGIAFISITSSLGEAVIVLGVILQPGAEPLALASSERDEPGSICDIRVVRPLCRGQKPCTRKGCKF